jgi:putative membrane protein insertion efficiency factor
MTDSSPVFSAAAVPPSEPEAEQANPAPRLGPLAWLLTGLVRGYQLVISPWLGPSCRFEPSCSAYALDALRLHGAFRGSWLVLRRLARCQPFCAGGYDPVPEPRRVRRRSLVRRVGSHRQVVAAPASLEEPIQTSTVSLVRSHAGSGAELSAPSPPAPPGEPPAMLSENIDPGRRAGTSEARNPVGAGSLGRGAP